MRATTFWLLLAGFNLGLTMLGHGSTDITVAFWSCMILSAVTERGAQ